MTELNKDRFSPEKSTPPETNDRSQTDIIIDKIKELPALPQVVMKLQELIVDDNSNAKKIADIIETDQAIVTKVLKLANSAYYGMSGKISSIQHASILLGYKTLSEIVTAAGAEAILGRKLPGYGYDAKDLWEHSLAVAVGSKAIAAMKNPAVVNDAYTAGLIHDIGKIILDSCVLERKEEIESFMEKDEKTFLEAETHFFDFHHADIAFEVCKRWKFPESMATAIKSHHQPSKSGSHDLSYILHAADYIARLSGIGYDDDDFLYDMESGTMEYLGLKQADVSDIALRITETVHKMSS